MNLFRRYFQIQLMRWSLIIAVFAIACGQTNDSTGPPISESQEAVQTVLLGDTTVRNTPDCAAVGKAEAYRFTATASGTLAALKVFIDGTNNASTIKLGIYKDTNNKPSTLLAKGSLSSPVNNAWNTVSLSATVSIAKNTRYWIANLGPYGGGLPMFRADGSIPGAFGSNVSTQSTLTDVPTTWSASNESYSGWSMSIYGVTADTGTGGTGGTGGMAGTGGSAGASGHSGSGGAGAGMAGAASGAGGLSGSGGLAGTAGSSAGASSGGTAGAAGSATAGQSGSGGIGGQAGSGSAGAGNGGISGTGGASAGATGSSGNGGLGNNGGMAGSASGSAGSSAGLSGSGGLAGAAGSSAGASSGGMSGAAGFATAGQSGSGGLGGQAGSGSAGQAGGGSGGSGGTLIFYDEFSASTLSSDWQVTNSGLYTDLGAYFTPLNVSTVTDNLNILTKADTSFPGATHSSGLVFWKSFNFTYGTISVRAKMPGGKGTWPALWLLGSGCQTLYNNDFMSGDCPWPDPGGDEIDFAEFMFGNFTSVNQQIHRTGSGDPGCYWNTSITDASQNWHTYQLEWLAGSLRFRVDGTQTCELTGAGVPNSPMFLIIDTGVTNAQNCCGGPIDDSTLPQTMLVDYVSVTQ